jgi:hypothetical protein
VNAAVCLLLHLDAGAVSLRGWPCNRASRAHVAVHGRSRPPLATHVSLTYERELRISFTDTSTNESGFALERQVFGVWQPVKTVPARPGTGSTVHIFAEDLDVEEQYCHRVRAYNLNGSTPSLAVCATTRPFAVPDPLACITRITHPAPGSLAVHCLSDAEMNTLFGSAAPALPLTVRAGKIDLDSDEEDLSPIPLSSWWR